MKANVQEKEVEPTLLTTEEAAKFLRISLSHLYHLTSIKEIRHYKPAGKKLYFYQADLVAYLTRREIKDKASIKSEASTLLHKTRITEKDGRTK